MISVSVRARTNLFVLLIVVLGPTGNMLLRKGMSSVGGPAHWTAHELELFFWRAFHCETVWLGISLLMLFFICQMLVLSWADYSYVLPASTVSYIFTALLGWLVLGEQVPASRWAGIALICVGAMVVGRTHPETHKLGGPTW